MRKTIWMTCLATMVLVAQPAFGGYKLMHAGKPALVSNSGLQVTPTIDWNRLGARPGRNAESWTLDGLTLNDLTFYGGIADGQTLFRDAKKKTEPLPRFASKMLIPEIVNMFESSYRVANSTSLMTIDSVEPSTFAGAKGFHFTYTFVIQNEEVRRKGEGNGAVIKGKLYLITFEAPVIHYYDAGIAEARKIAEGAQIVAVSPSS